MVWQQEAKQQLEKAWKNTFLICVKYQYLQSIYKLVIFLSYSILNVHIQISTSAVPWFNE